ncbi:hypothetical protein OGATHE_000612 [Ogataea polymorpha]|uniref:Uncharacterized protein n=1 Tax=Ogataea polymorpha TaxID=460523 RepID=A0A9P8PTA3_9ASCO|nr:hypothetical protein OGATHE_000612 [Ogataea polymorpha]
MSLSSPSSMNWLYVRKIPISGCLIMLRIRRLLHVSTNSSELYMSKVVLPNVAARRSFFCQYGSNSSEAARMQWSTASARLSPMISRFSLAFGDRWSICSMASSKIALAERSVVDRRDDSPSNNGSFHYWELVHNIVAISKALKPVNSADNKPIIPEPDIDNLRSHIVLFKLSVIICIHTVPPVAKNHHQLAPSCPSETGNVAIFCVPENGGK